MIGLYGRWTSLSLRHSSVRQTPYSGLTVELTAQSHPIVKTGNQLETDLRHPRPQA